MKSHMMESRASAEPHAQVLHQVPREIVKQWRHYDVLRGAGCGEPSKVHYGAKVLLQSRQQGLRNHGAELASKMILKNVSKRWEHVLLDRFKEQANMEVSTLMSSRSSGTA